MGGKTSGEVGFGVDCAGPLGDRRKVESFILSEFEGHWSISSGRTGRSLQFTSGR